jgi:nucleoid-associated protein YgaU
MFFDGSRYLRVADVEVTAPDGARARLKAAREPARIDAAADTALVYQVKQGDRLDLLAWRFFRNPRKWWLIADANPDVLAPDELLQPGRLLTIPRDRAL